MLELTDCFLPNRIVKIRLYAESKEIEFDVHFARIPLKGNDGMDLTVNWSSLNDDNRGVFYTDANAYKVVKNDINKKKAY